MCLGRCLPEFEQKHMRWQREKFGKHNMALFQAGVCRSKSCFSASPWEMYKCGKKVYCVFADLEKAYNKVNELELWNFLYESGIEGGWWMW